MNKLIYNDGNNIGIYFNEVILVMHYWRAPTISWKGDTHSTRNGANKTGLREIKGTKEFMTILADYVTL